MGFGILLLLTSSEVLPTVRTAVQALRHFGWSLAAACSRYQMSEFEPFLKDCKVMCIPFNESPKEIFPFAAMNDFSYVLSVGDEVIESNNMIHVKVDPSCSMIVTEPDKPTSRSFEISSDPSSWKDFVMAMILDGAPISATSIGDTLCVFKNNSVHNKSTVVRSFNIGKGWPCKIRIKPLWNFSAGSDMLIQLWSKYFEGTRFQLVDSSPDFYMVINATSEPLDPSKTIYFMMEPFGEVQYAKWIEGAGNSLLFKGDHKNHLNNCEWHCSWTLQEALSRSPPVDRTTGLSIIISDKAADPGQKYRIAVARALDEMQHSGKLPFPLEIWGKCASLNFHCYKGELAPYTKDSVLEKFSHHFNAENHSIANYVTEKLYDSILCGCHTLYWGAPNAASFFPPQSFTGLSGNIQADISTIINTVIAPVNNKLILAARDVILKQYSMPNRIEKILEATSATVCFMNKPNPEAAMSQGFKRVAGASLQIQDFSWIANLQSIYNGDSVLVVFDEVLDPALFSKLCRILCAIPESVEFIHMSGSGKIEGLSGFWYFRPTAIEKAIEMGKGGIIDARIMSNIRTAVCKI